MKSKYHGVVGVVIFNICFAAVVVYGIYLAGAIKGSIQVPQPEAVGSKIKLPEPGTMSYVSFLLDNLDGLSKLSGNRSRADLSLFQPAGRQLPVLPVLPDVEAKTADTVVSASPQPAQNIGKTDEKEKETAPVFIYKISFALVSQTGSLCIIDGKIYREGSTLSDGAKIVKIENDRIYMAKQDVEQWVYTKKQ